LSTPPVDEIEADRLAALVADEDYARAAELLTARLADAARDPRVHHNLAVVRYKQGRLAEAAAEADRALAASETPQTLYVKALALFDSGTAQPALAVLNRALEIEPDYERARYQRALVLFRLDRLDEARDDLERAGAWTAEDPDLPYNLAIVLAALGREDDAFRAAARALELDPGSTDEYLAMICELGERKVVRESYDQAHRFKNLLTLVGARLRELATDLTSRSAPGEVDDMSRAIGDEDRLFADLAAYLGAIRPSGAGDLAVVDAAEIVDGALVALTRPRGVEVTTDYAASLPEIVCEPGTVREAVFAVLVNAVEAVGKYGAITVTTRPGPAPAAGGASTVVIEIRNAGPSIPADLREAIFRPGFSTKPLGSGLGLALARRAVEAHGGTLELGPEPPGGGARFVFTIPPAPLARNPVAELTLRTPAKEEAVSLLL
jgi:signal transduction histidine kinase